jgi:hypothetical protein
MHVGIVAASVSCASLLAVNAHAGQSHYLLVRAGNQFTNQVVALPDLTPFVEATYQEGVAGVNRVWLSAAKHEAIGQKRA